MTVDGNQGGAPNYYPNSFSGPQDHKSFLESAFKVSKLGCEALKAHFLIWLGNFIGFCVTIWDQRLP